MFVQETAILNVSGDTHCTVCTDVTGLQWRTEGGGMVQPPRPEIPKAIQNRAKTNPIVKTVKIS